MDKFHDKMERKIAKEFKMVTQLLVASELQGENGSGNKKSCQDNLLDLVARKVDASEFRDEMQNKIS